MLIVYAGDVQCDYESRNGRCTSKAKYRIGGRHTKMKYYCTPHSKKDTVMRRELPEHPHPNELADARTGQYVTQAGINAKSRKEHVPAPELVNSCVQCARISMKKERDFLPPEGWICIFPNNYHGHGFGWGFGDFSGLSPMQLGPVNHQPQPGLPAATCIENRHQFEKVEVLDMDLEGPLCGCDRHLEWPHCTPNKDFDKLRIEGFANPKPIRHKHQKAKLKSAQKKFSKERPGPEVRYAVHRDAAGRDCHYTYLESRYFYCKDMETLALKSPAFQRLVELRKEGYQMVLCGYDGHPFPTGAITPQSAYEAFCDESKPFGHERVLAVLLTAHENPNWHLPNDYPWYRYFAEHLDVYSWERRQMKFQRLSLQESGESAQKKAKTEDEKK